MDVTDIGKVASRKRMNTDAEKLREKVSRETAKIIKLKVAQDTAYWDLKERLQQLAGAHERLQQNMVEVQMQHEAASAAYAAERRLRPDTLNKLAGARGVCDVLEEYGARLRRCVARAGADRAALQAAYGGCGAQVRMLTAQLARRADAVAAQRDAARESGVRADAAARQLAEAREQLGAARALAAERAVAHDQLAARLRQADEAAAALRDEVARLVRQFDAQTARMQQTIGRQEDEARAASADAARLRRDAAALQDELRRARELLADANNTIERMKLEEAARIDEIQNLNKVISDTNQHSQEMETEINSFKEFVRQLETEKLEGQKQLELRAQECGALRTSLDELGRSADGLRAALADEQQQHRQRRELDAARLDELRAAAAAGQRELDANSATIARLMTDLRAESDARARADAALAAARERLQAKDAELAQQLAVILDMRGEKERLQERIQGMQNTIDNIQKELTGRLAAPKGSAGADEPPELDAAPGHSELYSFLSDGSVDGDALDPREVGRRFAALARGGLRGRRDGGGDCGRRDGGGDCGRRDGGGDCGRRDGGGDCGRRDGGGDCGRRDGGGDCGERLCAAQGSISLSQVKDDFKMKSRTFFKNKRFVSKPKKIK